MSKLIFCRFSHYIFSRWEIKIVQNSTGISVEYFAGHHVFSFIALLKCTKPSSIVKFGIHIIYIYIYIYILYVIYLLFTTRSEKFIRIYMIFMRYSVWCIYAFDFIVFVSYANWCSWNKAKIYLTLKSCCLNIIVETIFNQTIT